MRIGYRAPTTKKMVSAKTTGNFKSNITPFNGKKDMGFMSNTNKSIYNKAYHKTNKNDK